MSSPSPSPAVQATINLDESSAPAPEPERAQAADAFDTTLFRQLLNLLVEQSATIKEHGKKLYTLVKNALKDEQPHDEAHMESEQLWGGLYEIAGAKIEEEAEEWKGLMDVSLVFIAIFLAVLTAFLVPVTQSLVPAPSSPSGDVTNNSTISPSLLPPKSEHNVCALYYLALITAMCNVVLCVVGRQWVGKLLSRPGGRTHCERTMRHEKRKELAHGWIKPLVAVLYWSLLLSIGVFIAGLLYQLRNLSTSFDESAPILETTWSLGILLAAHGRSLVY
ncbi:hypothetical protein SISNIDRAFT_483820 [Sistotremastrum niveocremeum HHB9708]|uniref:DUF6535 domain-containing protein n=1 Tax=Sistotremastrum niveocremeum HHB9708 TaxID=1314777 RepID=A0A164X3C3_9AGAM|nr:hypothetical protein SISNIDRAFT_483820 [Sistotremastrum niveocremeum HHB9708]